ncbi:hypothetical protein LOTGIDRAFT_157667 [Lottia gigantea]|uniref:Fibronectin type III-like domain-containing protein n=1 Tax=Lottia gigantea TaxID=225164 RepID=V4B2C5_LOTGI|nr:hypothetical protein LOTGIDRAFT_157667 [Lottia gigantea]ESP00457.1 hypothetical protein LOTGIDRAFT_157667 [Lottia gigantea]
MLTKLTLVFLSFAVQLTLQDYPFRNTSLPWEARVDDLISRITLDEIVQQMYKGGGGPHNGPAPPIKRLGIGPFQWDTECQHGMNEQNGTSFMQDIGFGASFSREMVRKAAAATSIEVRAINKMYAEKGYYLDHTGISCLNPISSLMRDPRWGRSQETYGEDPFLSGQLGQENIRGQHGEHPRYIRTSTTCMWFDVHGGPENIPESRFSFNAVVSERDWRTTFLPAFRYCIKGGSDSIMCSYNSINGVPTCANKKLLTDILRNEWGFSGYVITDQNAAENIIATHHYLNNSIDAAVAAVDAGVNLEIVADYIKNPVLKSITDAINQGKLTEDLVRERVKPMFYTRMRLGEFDPPEMNPFSLINTSVIESANHQALGLEAAMKSFVLLKNDGVLPFGSTKFNAAALVGPLADNKNFRLAADFRFAAGCSTPACGQYNSSAVKDAVANTDVVFVCFGLGNHLEKENIDRYDLELPGKQQQLLEDVVQYSGSAKIVLITFNANPTNIKWAEENNRISAIIAAFYPAQAAGNALRAVMTSSTTPQFGRLPYTWYYSADQVPAMTNYSMEGRTYRYFKEEPLYPFGYGLTYTQFFYDYFEAPDIVHAGEELHGVVNVENVGTLPGDEVIQIYLSWNNPSETSPQIQLVAFERFSIDYGATKTYKFSISPENMAIWTDDRGWVVEEGNVTIYAGGQQPNQKKSVGSNVLSRTVKILGYKNLGYY